MVCSEGNEGGVEEAEGLILMGGTCGWGWYVNDMQAFEDWKVEVCIHVFECARFRPPPPPCGGYPPPHPAQDFLLSRIGSCDGQASTMYFMNLYIYMNMYVHIYIMNMYICIYIMICIHIYIHTHAHRCRLTKT